MQDSPRPCLSTSAALAAAMYEQYTSEVVVAAEASAAAAQAVVVPALSVSVFCSSAHLVEGRGRETERGRGDESARHPEGSNSGNGGDLHISGCKSVLNQPTRGESLRMFYVDRKGSQSAQEIEKQEQTTSEREDPCINMNTSIMWNLVLKWARFKHETANHRKDTNVPKRGTSNLDKIDDDRARRTNVVFYT